MSVLSEADAEKNFALLDDLTRAVQRQQILIQAAYEGIKSGRTVPATQPKKNKRPAVEGVQCYVWKQDPSVTRIGIRKVFFPQELRVGPSDDCIQVVAAINDQNKDTLTTTVVSPGQDGNYLIDFAKDPYAFDQVNCWAVVRLAVNMYMRDLHLTEWRWQWDLQTPNGVPKTPLKIIAHAGEKPNATYTRGKKLLKFYWIADSNDTKTFLCRSLDIVAHEAGHAILDALKPSLYNVKTGQPGALHEAFADLTAMFTVLDQLDMCEDIIAETKCDLRQAKYLTAIAEQFGAAMSASPGQPMGDEDEVGDSIGMRNMNNTLRGSECPSDPYVMAELFSGYVFDVLCAIFQWERDPLNMSDAETLHHSGRIVRRMLLLALSTTGDTPNFCEIAHAMEDACDVIAKDDPADVPYYKKVLSQFRDRRELHLAGISN